MVVEVMLTLYLTLLNHIKLEANATTVAQPYTMLSISKLLANTILSQTLLHASILIVVVC